VGTRAQQTRQTLQRCALELFTERGFDGTTVEDIARAAGVSHMTFFRHFPTKESVLLDDPYDPVIAEAVTGQSRHLPALERVRRGLLAAWSDLPEPADEETRARVAIVAGHAGLRARAWENNQRTEALIVSALTDDGVPRLEARVAAGACLGALMAALLEWGDGHSDRTLGSCLVAALELLGGPDGAAVGSSRVVEQETG
jgi:AcrR family transcriptional regulator